MSYSQPGIFNVLDYGMIAGDPSYAVQNAEALQAAIDAAQASGNPGGGIVLIPSWSETLSGEEYGPYYIAPYIGSSIITIPDPNPSVDVASQPLLICGTGSGTTLIVLPDAAEVILFDVLASSFCCFQDLTVEYEINPSGGGLGTAFSFANSSASSESLGYKLFRVNVINCETAVQFGDNTDISNMLQCTVTYDASYPAGQDCFAVQINGTQANIEQCSLIYAVPGGGGESGSN